jgi:hypothetical protein
MLAQLKKLITEAAKCAMIRDLPTNTQKRELFANLARQLDNIAMRLNARLPMARVTRS